MPSVGKLHGPGHKVNNGHFIYFLVIDLYLNLLSQNNRTGKFRILAVGERRKAGRREEKKLY